MTVMVDTVTISLGAAHGCADFAGPLYEQLSTGYETCSVLPMPTTVDDWRAAHRTARKRADRARRLGYKPLRHVALDRRADDIFAINTSLDRRQGRPMSAGYREPVAARPDPDWPCEHHRVYRYGVTSGRTLVAYLWLYRAGDLALVSSILGHGDHLAGDVMYLLFETMLADQIDGCLAGYVVYNRHDSGTDGLRYFKEKLGFEPTEVAWAP